MPVNSLKTSLYIVIFTILISLVFVIFNQIDISISARYYTPGAELTFNETELAVLLKHVVRPTFKLATILSLLFILLLAFLMPQAMKNMRRHALFLFTCLALGPALMVEGVLKKRLWSGSPARYHRIWRRFNIQPCLGYFRRMFKKLQFCFRRCEWCCHIDGDTAYCYSLPPRPNHPYFSPHRIDNGQQGFGGQTLFKRCRYLCMPDNRPCLFYSLSFLPATEEKH